MVPEADEAGAGQDVALDLLHDEDDDGQDGGHCPCEGVEPLRLGVQTLLKVSGIDLCLDFGVIQPDRA